MNKQTQALKLALELLDKQWQCTQVWSLEEALDVADNIREALAEQPAQQQEPIAWIERDMQCDDFDPDSVTCQKPDIAADGWEWVPLYITTPRKPWVGLTDEEIEQVCVPLGAAMLSFTEVARAIEAKLREKNA